jgi:hypothetical protein
MCDAMQEAKGDRVMSDKPNPNRFAAENYSLGKEAKSRHVRLPRSAIAKNSFARMGPEEIEAFGRIHGAAVALHLQLIRLSGTHWARQRDGWVPFNREVLENIGLSDKRARHRAVQRLLSLGCIEIRSVAGVAGRRLEYRLNLHWAKPKAAVIDLEATRTARKQR